jgi:ligand-binding sensor domain-containing protein
LAVKVAMGTVRYASGQIAKNSPQNVAVTTPSATISVRGTDFTATVDELGRSTIILLPSCPTGWTNIERDCKTGKIWVETDEGRVVMDQPFQATKVESRGMMPSKPVILSLSLDAISNMLILSPPKEFKEDKSQVRAQMKGVLDVDFLKEQGLVNALEAQQKEMYQDKLSRNFLDSDFLANILDIVNAQLASQIDMLNKNNNNKLLPDWVATSGVTVELDEPKITLCRDSGSDVQCVTTPTKQNSTITQIQGSVEIRNRVNSGGSTIINLIQR